VKAVPSHTVGRRLEQLCLDAGLRLLLHAKAHLWTDLLNFGAENEAGIEFLSDFILFYTNSEGPGQP
jgi:hypothetical protein